MNGTLSTRYTSMPLLCGAAALGAMVLCHVPARAGQFQTIFAFSDTADDAPWGGVFAAPDGTLYATNSSGGADNSGTVLRLSPPPAGRVLWQRSLSRSFTGGADGGDPLAAPVVARSGLAFGTTAFGGQSNTYGVVYEFSPGRGVGSYRVVWNFAGGQDGGFPWAPITPGSHGEVYGTTTSASDGYGTVFRLQPPAPGSNISTLTILHTFTGGDDGDASASDGGLYRDAQGKLFGTTYNGGAGGNGVVYEVVPEPGGAYRFVLLHAFTGGSDGSQPECGLVADAHGTLYGTTSTGGAHGGGTVFRLVGSGISWELQTIHAFGSSVSPLGATPFGNVVVAPGGDLYGTTQGAGDNDNGVVFHLTPPAVGSSAWTYAVVHRFGYLTDGANPRGLLSLGPDGAVYGTTFDGGPGLGGTVFRYVP